MGTIMTTHTPRETVTCSSGGRTLDRVCPRGLALRTGRYCGRWGSIGAPPFAEACELTSESRQQGHDALRSKRTQMKGCRGGLLFSSSAEAKPANRGVHQYDC